MSQDKCTIQVNGVECEARPGQMLIEVTDAAGIYVPRFCYHPKLSIAANCRMCLVEVENAPKPLPACATPVTPGMKVHTRSRKAIGAQKATMEFLLINHPLDCPICDQGGECELQDLAMGLRPRCLPLHRAQARRQRQGYRAAGVHRHDPVHSLHPLRALYPGNRRLPGTRHHRPRRPDRDRSLY